MDYSGTAIKVVTSINAKIIGKFFHLYVSIGVLKSEKINVFCYTFQNGQKALDGIQMATFNKNILCSSTEVEKPLKSKSKFTI